MSAPLCAQKAPSDTPSRQAHTSVGPHACRAHRRAGTPGCASAASQACRGARTACSSSSRCECRCRGNLDQGAQRGHRARSSEAAPRAHEHLRNADCAVTCGSAATRRGEHEQERRHGAAGTGGCNTLITARWAPHHAHAQGRQGVAACGGPARQALRRCLGQPLDGWSAAGGTQELSQQRHWAAALGASLYARDLPGEVPQVQRNRHARRSERTFAVARQHGRAQQLHGGHANSNS